MLAMMVRRTAATSLKLATLAAGITWACAPVAHALPQFTWNPAAVGLNGSAFVADNIILSDFSTVVLTPNGSGGADFTDVGTLAVGAFQLGASFIGGGGLNTSFGMYFSFNATGTQNTPGFGSSTVGTFSTLEYTLYGYNISGPVEYHPSDATPTGVVDPIALGTGSLVGGGVGASTIPGVGSVPNANTLLSFAPTVQGEAFFVSPDPFYMAVFAAFTNNPSQVAFNGTGFVITQGGGSANFLPTATPEPASVALLGAGLIGVGLFRRRSRRV
jgi:hypothetical protein